MDPNDLTPGKHRIDISPGTIAHQQFLDGRALWRLREALPGYVVTVKRDAAAYGPGWLVSAEDGVTSAMFALEGTITEAADKCREALT